MSDTTTTTPTVTQTDPAAAQATYLGALRQGLTDEGFNPDEVSEITRTAAVALFQRTPIEIIRTEAFA